MKPKIYAFINNGEGTDMLSLAALAEDGHFLAYHMSSNDVWARLDMGLGTNNKHDLYHAHFPGGYILEWVEGNPKNHLGVMAAYEKHLALPIVEEK